jgi:hypothetical protein
MKVRLKLSSDQMTFLSKFLQELAQEQEPPVAKLDLEWAVACQLFDRHLRNFMLVKGRQITLTWAEGIAIMRLLIEKPIPPGYVDMMRNQLIGDIQRKIPWKVNL